MLKKSLKNLTENSICLIKDTRSGLLMQPAFLVFVNYIFVLARIVSSRSSRYLHPAQGRSRNDLQATRIDIH